MLEEGFRKNIKDLGLDLYFTRLGTMMCLFFHSGPVVDYATAKECDTKRFGVYFQSMLER